MAHFNNKKYKKNLFGFHDYKVNEQKLDNQNKFIHMLHIYTVHDHPQI